MDDMTEKPTETYICESCERATQGENAWGPDGDGCYLCPPCAYAHLESLIPDDVKQMTDDPDEDPPTKDTQIQELQKEVTEYMLRASDEKQKAAYLQADLEKAQQAAEKAEMEVSGPVRTQPDPRDSMIAALREALAVVLPLNVKNAELPDDTLLSHLISKDAAKKVLAVYEDTTQAAKLHDECIRREERERLVAMFDKPGAELFLDGRNEHGSHVLPGNHATFPFSFTEEDLHESAERILSDAEALGFKVGVDAVWTEWRHIDGQYDEYGRCEIAPYWDYVGINAELSRLLFHSPTEALQPQEREGV